MAGLHALKLTHHVSEGKSDDGAEAGSYALCASKPAYRLPMPPRGFSIDVPSWWLDDLMAAIKARGLTHTDLAMMLIPPKPHLQGDDLKRAVSAARVKVSRFFDENAAKRIRTIEMIRAWTDALSLTPFEYRAASREQAAALRLAMADPAQIQRVINAGRLALSIESGETRLEDLLGRQSPQVDSSHGGVDRRGPRRAPARPTNPRREPQSSEDHRLC